VNAATVCDTAAAGEAANGLPRCVTRWLRVNGLPRCVTRWLRVTRLPGNRGRRPRFYTARAGVGGKAVTLGPADQSTQVAIPVRKPQSYRPDLSALLSIKAAQKGQAGSYNGSSWQGEAQVRNISCIVPGL